MAELIIPTTNSGRTTNWWSNFFWACGSWRETEHVLAHVWHARVESSPIAGEVGKIIFENERDITMFLLKWS